MSGNAIFIIVSVYLLVVHVESSTIANTKAEELYDYIVAGQNKDIRPCIGCSGPLEINVTFHLTSLNDMDEVRGEMNSIGYLTVQWYDDRIFWNPADYAGVPTLMLSPEKIWSPILLVGNPSRKLSTLNRDVVPVRVLYNGLVIWNPGDVFLTKCYPDIYRYPYDAQQCYISIVPWGALPTEILLRNPTDEIFTPYFTNNGEWILQETKAVAYVENDMSVAKYIFTYSRRPQFFVVNVILPIILLSYLNCIVFVIPTESGERISYAITVLLSFAVFMTLVGDNIPKTSAPMSLLCYYLITVFAGSTFVMVSTIFNITIFYRDPKIPITALYKTAVRITSIEFQKKSKVLPEEKALPHNMITVMPVPLEHKPSMSSEVEDDRQNSFSESEESPNVGTEPDNGLTWKVVAKALDTISLFGFFVYFTSCTVIQLLFIAIPKSY